VIGQGLFAKAITQSGSLQAIATPDDAARVNAVLSELLACEITAADLSKQDPAAVLAAQRALTNDLDDTADAARFSLAIVASRMPFIPRHRPQHAAGHPIEAIAAGAGATVSLLTGTNAQENRIFMVASGAMDAINAESFDQAVTGPNPPQQLADDMHAAWIAFARTGDPGWPAYAIDRTFMIFDEPRPRIAVEHRRKEREAWTVPTAA